MTIEVHPGGGNPAAPRWGVFENDWIVKWFSSQDEAEKYAEELRQRYQKERNQDD